MCVQVQVHDFGVGCATVAVIPASSQACDFQSTRWSLGYCKGLKMRDKLRGRFWMMYDVCGMWYDVCVRCLNERFIPYSSVARSRLTDTVAISFVDWLSMFECSNVGSSKVLWRLTFRV
jgi:hypothetical protein